MMVRAGDQILWLQTPPDMCFVDRTVPLQGLMFAATQAFLRGEAVPLAVFAGCDELNASKGDPSNLNFFRMGGYIAWLNPTFAPDLKIPREDFLQVFSAMIQDYAKSDYDRSLKFYGETSLWQQKRASLNAFIPQDIDFSPDVWRTPWSVSTGYMAQSKVFGRNWHYSTLIGGTMVRGVPLVVNIGYTDLAPVDLNLLAAQMDLLTQVLVYHNEEAASR